MTSTGDPYAGLKAFQRVTATHVDRMFFVRNRSRFLVADEVGLGKTLVARGVVARALQRFADQKVKRVDIVYISSNAEIGRQNIRRLVPHGYQVFDRLDRLTLLSLHVNDLSGRDRPNFVSFTPGTMPDASSRSGWSRERALIYVLLARAWNLRLGRGAIRLLMHPVRDEQRFRDEIREIRNRKPDRKIGNEFVRLVECHRDNLRETFQTLTRSLARQRPISPLEREQRLRLVAQLRLLLAQASVDALEPDMVILDEFQRFRHLLDEDSETALLFQAICNYADTQTGSKTKVLMLSATPYRMYTTRDESDDHYSDFIKTVRFLLDHQDARTDAIAALLDDYRTQILRGTDARALIGARDALSDRLREIMVRTERLAVTADRRGMLDPHPRRGAQLLAADARSYATLDATLRDIADRAGASGMEYWKSAPFLPNFMDTYQLKKQLRAAADTGPTARALANRWRSGDGLLPFDAVRSYSPVSAPNPRIRTLEQDLLDAGLWRCLWIPPSLPYYQLGRPFADCRQVTKRLVFSSWRVAPRAIATLTSYEAERRMIAASERAPQNTAEGRVKLDRRLLDFKVAVGKGGRRTGMPALALMYPASALAQIDPLELAREHARQSLPAPSLDEARAWARARVAALLDQLPPDADDGPPDERWFWAAPIILDGEPGEAWLARRGLAALWSDGSSVRWDEHVRLAADAAAGRLDPPLGRRPEGLVDTLADLALAGPGVACLRAVARVVDEDFATTNASMRDAAARAAWGLRVLLNHPESTTLIRAGRHGPYWRRALAYCVEGGLQAVLDEFAHLAFDLRAIGRLDHAQQAAAVGDAIRGVTMARTARIVPDEIVVRGRRAVFEPHSMRSRFARAYGELSEDETGEQTPAEAVRDAFNSPFAPFVLASTSVGQEGLDFHPYCHAVVHWNLPANPVDLEQREGRVHRYKGHAVRKNVALAVGIRSFLRDDADPWRALFSEAEKSEAAAGDAEIVPYWIFPGDAKIERHVPALPLSGDEERLRRLLESLALYRSVLGQARQEELVELLSGRGLPDGLRYEDLRIDLSPRR